MDLHEKDLWVQFWDHKQIFVGCMHSEILYSLTLKRTSTTHPLQATILHLGLVGGPQNSGKRRSCSLRASRS